MKKFRIKIERWILNIENRWKYLPHKRQRLYTIIFFSGYFILTLIGVLQIWMGTKSTKNILSTEHISGINKDLDYKIDSSQQKTFQLEQKSSKWKK